MIPVAALARAKYIITEQASLSAGLSLSFTPEFRHSKANKQYSEKWTPSERATWRKTPRCWGFWHSGPLPGFSLNTCICLASSLSPPYVFLGSRPLPALKMGDCRGTGVVCRGPCFPLQPRMCFPGEDRINKDGWHLVDTWLWVWKQLQF